jgi:peroxisome-assembly ATPase
MLLVSSTRPKLLSLCRRPPCWSRAQHIVIVLQQQKQSRWLGSLSAAAASATTTTHHNSKWNEGPLHDRYYEIVQDSVDPIQLRALRSLERLRHDLLMHEPPPQHAAAVNGTNTTNNSSNSGMSSLFTGWMGAHSSWLQESTANAATALNPTSSALMKQPKIRGVYLHGGVGCGKTFLMNMIFHDSLADTKWANERQKTHFHKFLLRVHQEMHAARKNNHGAAMTHDILPTVIDKIAAAGRLLCFDEFQVTDVADALILQRLFTGLWEKGCVVVATSNRPPDDLYLNGLQRDRFLPFIEQLKVHCKLVSMWESETDYRLMMKLKDENDDSNWTDNENKNPMGTNGRSSKNNRRQVYFKGGKEAWREFDALFYEMAGPRAVAPMSLRTQGRNVKIPQAALSKGICRFSFEDLCTKALGAADYLLLGQHFHTVFVDNIPILKLEHLNWVRRFIIFVDSMYQCNCKLILHAKTDAADIFQPGTDTGSHDEVFAFDRTVSRLQEMSSQTYLQKQQKVVHPVESKASLLSQQRAVINVMPAARL